MVLPRALAASSVRRRCSVERMTAGASWGAPCITITPYSSSPPSAPISHSTSAGDGLPPLSDVLGSPTPFRSSMRPPITRPQLDALALHPLTHHIPARVKDHVCIRMVRALRWVSDRFYHDRYVHRALMLKMIAGSPFAAAYANRCCLHGIFRPKSWGCDEARLLLSALECAHTHAVIAQMLSTMSLPERVALLVVRTVHYALCFAIHVLSPRMGYRLLGYLLEESNVILTHAINDVDSGKVVPVQPLPTVCLSFWGLANFRLPPAIAPTTAPAAGGGQQGEEPLSTSTILGTSGSSASTTASTPLSSSSTSSVPSSRKDVSPRHSDGGDTRSAAEAPTASVAVEDDQQLLTLRDVLLLMRGDEMFYRDAFHALANRLEAHREATQHGGSPPTAFR